VVLTNVSEERIASIFRVEEKIRKSPSEEAVKNGTSRLSSIFPKFIHFGSNNKTDYLLFLFSNFFACPRT
jgi:hypothetical protein